MVCAVCSAPSLSTPAQSEPPPPSDSANQLHQILALSDEDEGLVWEAVYDVYPNVEGDQVILGRSFRLDTRPIPITDNADSFLAKEFEIPNLGELPVTSEVSCIIQDRLDEAQLCFSNGAYLSAILLYGSILEAVLLGRS